MYAGRAAWSTRTLHHVVMGRVEWGRYSGEDIEEAIGILLRRKYSDALRIRPSQGDKGVDIVRIGEDGATVFQVKKFAANLTAGQKTQISKSLRRVGDFIRDDNSAPHQIRRWNLVVPLNPTLENLKWFNKLTKDEDFECNWWGRDYIDGLAAEFPEVIDYYFRDGKERLAVALKDLAIAGGAFINVSSKESDELQPVDVRESLSAIHRIINKIDPHFRYDYAVDSQPPTYREQPGLIFSTTEGREGCYVTFHVYEKYRGASEDRPVIIDFELPVSGRTDDTAAKDFIKYGVPFEGRARNIVVGGEGAAGFGGEFTEGLVKLLPASQDHEKRRKIRIRAVSPAGEELAVAKVEVGPASTGPARAGLRVSGREESGVFTFELRADFGSQETNISFKLDSIFGKPPLAAMPGVKLLNALVAPNSINIGPEYGRFTEEYFSLPSDIQKIVPDALGRLLENLVTIQNVTSTQITIPVLEDTEESRQQIRDIERTARLLNGERVDVEFEQLKFTSNGAPVPEEAVSILLTFNIDFKLNEAKIDIGSATFHSSSAVIEVDSSDKSGQSLVVKPASGNKIVGVMWLPSRSPGSKGVESSTK